MAGIGQHRRGGTGLGVRLEAAGGCWAQDPHPSALGSRRFLSPVVRELFRGEEQVQGRAARQGPPAQAGAWAGGPCQHAVTAWTEMVAVAALGMCFGGRTARFF